MKKIEKSKYTGYIWKSDSKEPELFFDKEFELNLDDDVNPFVIEAWLTDGNKSINIKFFDGQHHIYTFNLISLQNQFKSEDAIYLPSFKGVKNMQFKQFWKPEVDEFCENMEVLKPSEFVFVGFNK